MRLEQLHNIMAIIHTGSIRTAAAKRHITQQSLSASVKALEKELGLVLFERSVHGVTLTVDGQYLLPHFENLLQEYESILSYTALQKPTASENLTGDLHFACSTMVSRFIVPQIAERFQKHYPQVTMAIPEFPISQFADLAAANSFDLLLFHVERSELQNFVPPIGYQTETLLLDFLVVTCGKHSPLANRRVISLSSLVKHPFAFFSVEPIESIWTYRKIFSDHGLKPKAFFQTNIESTFYGKLIDSDYLALSSKFCDRNFDYLQKQNLVSIALKDKIEFYYLLAIRDGALEKPYIRDFIAIVKQLFFNFT